MTYAVKYVAIRVMPFRQSLFYCSTRHLSRLENRITRTELLSNDYMRSKQHNYVSLTMSLFNADVRIMQRCSSTASWRATGADDQLLLLLLLHQSLKPSLSVAE